MDRYSSNASTIHNPTDDVSKHIKSLQARLGFARFKMKQGWTNSTLLDVEQLWKQKQRQSINELPKPRFTQRDIIDKRVYIPSPGARNAKSKKAKLVRTYSMDNNKSLCFHHYNHGKKHKSKVIPLSIDVHSPSSPSSTYSDNDQHSSATLNNNKYTEEPPVRNSLDYLSYAIAMTEREEITSCSQPLPDISEMEPNLIEQEDKEEEDQKMLSPPSSPATSAAAKAIMMFVNNNNSQQQSASSP